MTQGELDELDESDLVADFLEGNLSGERLEQFCQLLSTDSAVVYSLVDSAVVHDLLSCRYADERSDTAAVALLTSLKVSHDEVGQKLLNEPASNERRFWASGSHIVGRYRLSVAALAAMLLVTGGLYWMLWTQTVELATVTRTIETKFGSAPLQVGARLTQGQRIEMQEGIVEISYDNGAVMAVKAPADIELVTSMLARSRAGRVTVDVGEHAHGFTIETPTASVVDWGTEFGVGVQAGETDVVVFKGAVDLHANLANDASEQSKRLQQGDALRVGVDGGLSRIVSMNSREFPIPNMSELSGQSVSPVIASVSDNIRGNQTTKCYRIVHGGLHEDSAAYVDRSHQWNGLDAHGLPKFLLGADYIMTFNNDKRATDLEVAVTFAQDANVYVFFDKRRAPPKWLTEHFEDLGIEIGLDEGPSRLQKTFKTGVGPGESIDNRFGVWKSTAISGEKIVFGSQYGTDSKSDAHSMYGVAATLQ